jgi:hypothetical protein
MKIELSQTPQGYARVAWVQSTSETGETVGSMKFKWLIGTGLIGGFILGVAMGELKMLFFGPLFGVMALVASAGHDEKKRGGPPKEDAAPILVQQYCEARIERHQDQLVLAWEMKGKKLSDSFVIPLAEATELIVGGMNEWFSDRAAVIKYIETYVIVMPLPDGRVLRLADHAGRQAELAELHTVLSQALIEPRTKLLRDLQAELRARERGVEAVEIPDSF